jgi:hypothetical protein
MTTILVAFFLFAIGLMVACGFGRFLARCERKAESTPTATHRPQPD